MSPIAEETYTIAAIQNGSEIDHIPAGQGMRLFRLLQLEKYKVTIGLQYPSEVMGEKDIVKVEGLEISEEESSRIAIFAPSTTVAIIRDGEVVQKFQVPLPETIHNVIICPNPRCISNHEATSRTFSILQVRKKIMLCCHYCERTYAHHEINEYEV